jgi:RNA polymerase sigma-70 factor (ECF subfamily)
MPFDLETAAAPQEEIDLVAAIRAGDERAFTTVVERHYGAMLALARAYALPPATAEEVVHGAFMTALAANGEFDGGTLLRTWLLGFAARAAAPRAAADEDAGRDTAPTPVDPVRFRGSRDAFPGHWRA